MQENPLMLKDLWARVADYSSHPNPVRSFTSQAYIEYFGEQNGVHPYFIVFWDLDYWDKHNLDIPQNSLQNHVLKIKWSDGEIRVTDGDWILHYDGSLDEFLDTGGRRRTVYKLTTNYRLDIPFLNNGKVDVIIDLRVDSAPLIVQRSRQKKRRSKRRRSTKKRIRKTQKRIRKNGLERKL